MIPVRLFPLTEESVASRKTAFIKRDDFYHWRTDVELQQIYGLNPIPSPIPSSTLRIDDSSFPTAFRLPNDRLRTVVVSVQWKAKVSSFPQLKFSDESIDSVEFASERFRQLHFNEYSRYSFPRLENTDTEEEITD